MLKGVKVDGGQFPCFGHGRAAARVAETLRIACPANIWQQLNSLNPYGIRLRDVAGVRFT